MVRALARSLGHVGKSQNVIFCYGLVFDTKEDLRCCNAIRAADPIRRTFQACPFRAHQSAVQSSAIDLGQWPYPL
jgi:hypothetical protein